MKKISLIIITHNSEETLEECLQSVQGLVSEIILVDDSSSDNTVSIAKKFNAKVIQNKLESCAQQKQFALNHASNDWVFLLDSDESCTQNLKDEISSVLETNGHSSAYQVPRRNFYFGKWLRFGGKYPDLQTRVFKKSSCQFSQNFSHEKIIVNGHTGRLKAAIDHQAYPDLDIWMMKLKRTAEFDALEWERKGIRPSPWNSFLYCFLRPSIRFFRKYFLKGGFLDGYPGLMASLHDVLTQIFTYHILSQKKNQR